MQFWEICVLLSVPFLIFDVWGVIALWKLIMEV
jgi:hypothetical protein